MILSFLFYPIFSFSYKPSDFNLYTISTFLTSLSNLTFKGKSHQISSSRLVNIYSNHPIFLGIPKHSPVSLSLNSINFQLITSPLIQGSFSRVTLDSIRIENSKIASDHCGDIINVSTSDYLPIFFDCNVTIRNCRIENYFPTTDKFSTTRSSVIQSYFANVEIDHSSFLFCNSNTSPVLFSALSNISFLYSNFSFNNGETEGVFSMTHTKGNARGCFFGNNEAHENGICSISESKFNFYSNAIVHNRADINSIVFLTLSNSTLNYNYFVANRIQSAFYGIVSVYDDLKTKTDVSFIRCIFSLNKEIEDLVSENNNSDYLNKKIVSSGRRVYSIFYRGDDSIDLDHCTFDTSIDQSIIVFDGGSFKNIGSSFGQSIKTQYDVFDTIPFIESKRFKMDFEASKSIIFSVCILALVLIIISIVIYFLNRISSLFF